MSAPGIIRRTWNRVADRMFTGGLVFVSLLYAGLIVAMLVADAFYADPGDLRDVMTSPAAGLAAVIEVASSKPGIGRTV